jgi:hypothetical protein
MACSLPGVTRRDQQRVSLWLSTPIKRRPPGKGCMESSQENEVGTSSGTTSGSAALLRPKEVAGEDLDAVDNVFAAAAFSPAADLAAGLLAGVCDAEAACLAPWTAEPAVGIGSGHGRPRN